MEVAGLGSPTVEKRESVLHSRFMKSHRSENSQFDRMRGPTISPFEKIGGLSVPKIAKEDPLSTAEDSSPNTKSKNSPNYWII
jgi:hypothetical protein